MMKNRKHALILRVLRKNNILRDKIITSKYWPTILNKSAGLTNYIFDCSTVSYKY